MIGTLVRSGSKLLLPFQDARASGGCFSFRNMPCLLQRDRKTRMSKWIVWRKNCERVSRSYRSFKLLSIAQRPN